MYMRKMGNFTGLKQRICILYQYEGLKSNDMGKDGYVASYQSKLGLIIFAQLNGERTYLSVAGLPDRLQYACESIVLPVTSCLFVHSGQLRH